MHQPLTSEPVLRKQIDAVLRESGWAVHRGRQLNRSAANDIAVWALVVKGGEANYTLSVRNKLGAVLKAKWGATALGGVEAQTRGIPNGVNAPITPSPSQCVRMGGLTWAAPSLDPEPSVSFLDTVNKRHVALEMMEGAWS